MEWVYRVEVVNSSGRDLSFYKLQSNKPIICSYTYKIVLINIKTLNEMVNALIYQTFLIL